MPEVPPAVAGLVARDQIAHGAVTAPLRGLVIGVAVVAHDRRMSEQKVIWRDGDRWRNLTGEAVAAGQVTVISESGATRLLDIEQKRHGRMAIEGGHSMRFDGVWRPMGSFELTPCGVVIEQSGARGTPVRLVLAGLVTDWLMTPLGSATVDAVIARRPPVSPRHPEAPCKALYCLRRRGLSELP